MRLCLSVSVTLCPCVFMVYLCVFVSLSLFLLYHPPQGGRRAIFLYHHRKNVGVKEQFLSQFRCIFTELVHI